MLSDSDSTIVAPYFSRSSRSRIVRLVHLDVDSYASVCASQFACRLFVCRLVCRFVSVCLSVHRVVSVFVDICVGFVCRKLNSKKVQ